VNFLLWPRRFLKKAPPPLSKAQALMMRGEWEQAQFLLKNWHREYPGSANIALDLFGLLADHFQRYDEALQTACETLESSCRIREEAAVPLLGRVTDLLCAAGHQEKAVELLRREAERSSLYAPEQLRNIKQRENALRKEL